MTISPIYLSRMLNSIPCSISVCRDDPFSIVAIIELSRRFSAGLWNCIQFWACCGCSLAVINMLNACISLPPIFTPITLLYLMCIAVPLLSLALIRIELDLNIMNRATGKKQTKFDSRVFGFVIWCYGCKFLTPILVVVSFLLKCKVSSLIPESMPFNFFLRCFPTVHLWATRWNF